VAGAILVVEIVDLGIIRTGRNRERGQHDEGRDERDTGEDPAERNVAGRPGNYESNEDGHNCRKHEKLDRTKPITPRRGYGIAHDATPFLVTDAGPHFSENAAMSR
jgi:hypothetical protein